MRFRVEPRLLDHFGVAMYNTLEKAIAELAANGYDADASAIQIVVGPDEIIVADDGRGMTAEEVQEDYLRLGRDRRAAEQREKTGKRKRPIIGHKGIGKLAGLGIAERMIVKTVRRRESTTLTIDRAALDEAASLEQFDLKAEVEKAAAGAHGTEVRLEGLLINVGEVDEEALREHLALELPTERNWRVSVNGIEASAEDVPGDRFPIDDEIEGFGRVTGFYKVVKRRKGMPAGFAVRIRKRIVQPTTLFGLNQQAHGFFVLTRIIGELEPDFIDPVDDGADPERAFDINTSRTGLNPESARVQALEDYARNKLVSIADGIAKERAAKRKAAAKGRNPDLEARMQRLGPEVYAKLDAMLDKVIAQLAKNESNKTIDDLVDIIVRYYESDALRTLVDSIKEESDEDVVRLAELLAQFGATRISDIAELLHGQLIVIESLRAKVAEGSLEAEIHKVIAANIWLLRESLTYWFDNKAFSTQLADKLADEFKLDAAKRPDLVCFDNSKLTAQEQAGKLLVVEFKRPGVSVGYEELAQVMAYKSIFKASLASFEEEDIEVIVLGDTFDGRFDRDGLGPGYTVLSYLELLDRAKVRYRDIYEMLVPEGTVLPGLEEALAIDETEGSPGDDEDWEDVEPEPLEQERG
jgi:hypothetical protein